MLLLREERGLRMRMVIAAMSAAVLTFEGSAALAKKSTPAQAAPSVWYFNLGGLTDQADIDAVLKETRRGARLLSAELDLCYLGRDGWTAIDRFVVPLDIKGKHLSGTGRSTEAGKPVKADLKRSKESDGTTFEGSISYGEVTRKIVSVGNLDVSAKDFESDRKDDIFEEPADFAQAAPDSVAVRVERASISGVLEALRGEKARIETYSLRPTCRALRTGQLDIEIQIDPERAVSLVARLRKMPGVVRAGWSSRGFPIDRSARINAAPWRNASGKIDREKLGQAIAGIVGKAMSAGSCAASWDEVTGELTVTAERPDRSIPGAGLTESLSAYFLVSGEKPEPSDMLVIRLGYVSSRLADIGPGARLTLVPESEDGTVEPEGADTIVTLLAKELQGQVWNEDAAAPGWAK